MKKYLEYKLKIPSTVTLNEEELLEEYQIYAQSQMERTKKLDLMLVGIDDKTFDK